MDALPHAQTEPGTESHAGAEFFCQLVADQQHLSDPRRRRVLVAGSGEGHEAVFISGALEARVVALDMNFSLQRENTPQLSFAFASVEKLPLRDAAFDAVFYHHVIEHVADPVRSLMEIARVIAPGGFMFIGTPNRHRLLSAVGSHDNPHWRSSFANKLRENARDWHARVTGRFRNHLGAHAGFSRMELDKMLAPYFSRRVWLTREYLLFKYKAHQLLPVIKAASLQPQVEFLAPSIYAICSRT